MMADAASALFSGAVALAVCAAAGWPFARRLFPGMAVAMSPTLGWAAFHALASPVVAVAGFGLTSVGGLATLLLAAAFADGWVSRNRRSGEPARWPGAPPLAYALALALAAACAALLLPQAVNDGVAVTSPVFDHSKVAIADAIARTGAPPENPFYAEAGGSSTLVYYYLWHLGVAALALLPGVDAWSADVGLTGFTAFAAFGLAMGLAVRLSGRASAAYWTLALTATASARPLIKALLGPDALSGWISAYPGLEATLVQGVWAPQHLASACCVVVAALAIERLSRQPEAWGTVVLGLVAAAAFGSSIWVGGVVLASVALAAGALGLGSAPSALRLRFATCCVVAAALAAMFAWPILAAQAGAAAARSGGLPIAFHSYEVLGGNAPAALRRILDLPAFWALRLPLDAPAIVLIGAAGLVWLLRGGATTSDQTFSRILALTAVAALAVGWLLTSTVLNNDLGWRAPLPAFLVLAASGGAALARCAPDRPFRLMAAGAALAVGLTGAAAFFRDEGAVRPFAEAGDFARSPAVWEAVRRQSGPEERVVNNPRLFAAATPWPANLSWALFSDRPSCYAGWEFARPFAPVSPERVAEIDRAFARLFAGEEPNPHALLEAHDCRLVVLHRSDRAYEVDPFARDARFRRLDAPEGWRIYRVL